MEQELTALLAAASPQRYWGRAPQTPTPSRPYIVLSRISGVRNYHTQGASGFVSSRVQIDIYGDTYVSVHDTAKAVVAAISGYRGGTIQGVFIDSQRDMTWLEQGDPNELHRLSLDAIVHHSE